MPGNFWKNGKPEVDFISGIPPAIAIEQKVNTRNPRSTVGTSTEIYDYLRLLYSRIGRTYSPVSGKEVKRHSVDDVVKYIIIPEIRKQGTYPLPSHPARRIDAESFFSFLVQQGFTRIIESNGEIIRIDRAEILNICLERENVSYNN